MVVGCDGSVVAWVWYFSVVGLALWQFTAVISSSILADFCGRVFGSIFYGSHSAASTHSLVSGGFSSCSWGGLLACLIGFGLIGCLDASVLEPEFCLIAEGLS
ncbi:hypothetical protein U1Q18_025202 [Sarracenia purpurea var. burkii]